MAKKEEIIDLNGYITTIDVDRQVGLYLTKRGNYFLRTLNSEYVPVEEHTLFLSPEAMEAILQMYKDIQENLL